MMHSEKITLRAATVHDVPFLAMVIAEALDDDIMEQYEQAGNRIPDAQRERMDIIEKVIAATDTLYTWHHGTIAQDAAGTPLGALVAYSGDDYMQRREVTFRMFASVVEQSFDPSTMDAETVPGEFYLDSLAVLPSHRGRGVARILLESGIKKAKSMARPAILACSPENVGAKRLYESLGFRGTHIYSLFGHPYWRMIHE